jgi:Holliday junction resolvase
MVNSRAKGCRGEREWAEYLRGMGFAGARRGQQFSGSPDSPDVVGGIPGTHPEVKRVEALNLTVAMAQAEQDCGEGTVPYVAHRRDRTPWLVTVRAIDLAAFARRVLGVEEPDVLD